MELKLEPQHETVDKFDKAVGGLLDGNNLHTNATTVQHITMTKAEQFTIQTVRVSDNPDKGKRGDHVIIIMVDKDGRQRFILPPRATDVIARQKDALTRRVRSIRSKARMKARGPMRLTDEQKRKMQAGRAAAIAKRKARKAAKLSRGQ